MAAVTCADCGSPMVRRAVAYLCGGGGPGAVYGDPECSNTECRRRQREQDLADQTAREKAAIADAIARGVILP